MCQPDLTLLAGVYRHAGQSAVAYYCARCNTTTWHSAGRDPLKQSRGADTESREAALNRWLSKPVKS